MQPYYWQKIWGSVNCQVHFTFWMAAFPPFFTHYPHDKDTDFGPNPIHKLLCFYSSQPTTCTLDMQSLKAPFIHNSPSVNSHEKMGERKLIKYFWAIHWKQEYGSKQIWAKAPQGEGFVINHPGQFCADIYVALFMRVKSIYAENSF